MDGLAERQAGQCADDRPHQAGAAACEVRAQRYADDNQYHSYDRMHACYRPQTCWARSLLDFTDPHKGTDRSSSPGSFRSSFSRHSTASVTRSGLSAARSGGARGRRL